MKSCAPPSLAAAMTASSEDGVEASPRAMFSRIWNESNLSCDYVLKKVRRVTVNGKWQ